MNPQTQEAMSRAYADGYFRRSPEGRREDGYPTLACWHEHRRGERARQAIEAAASEAREVA